MLNGPIAFLIQAHCNPPQIAEAVRRLQYNGHRAFIHYDRKSADDLSLIQNNLISQRIPVYHAGISQVNATLHMLRAARAAGRFDYYFLMSGQCFPVNDVAWLESRVGDGNIYLNYRAMPIETWAKRLDRLEHFYFERDGAVSRLANRFLKRLPKRNFVKGLSLWPYAGSNWWCLPHDVVNYVLEYVDRYPYYHRYMRYTSYPDEVYFHSIISNMELRSRLRPALFYARFNEKTGRPFVFDKDTIGDIPTEEVFVARKFDSRVDSSFLSVF
jgi:hypothetical protein